MKAWEKNVRNVVPYVAGEQPQQADVVKLNTNENPYPPAPEVQEIVKDFECGVLRKYPDPDVSALCKELADYHKLDKNQVFVGVGSDDVISVAFLTFFASDTPILFPNITYAFYPVWAELYRIPYKTPELDESFKIKKEDYLVPNGGIVLANPNAPTSIMEPLPFIEDILKANPESVVIVDEAYIDFGGESALPLLDKYDNLLVIRTFSKSRSMAGMRIGYACGCKEAIAAMNSVKASINSYTMSHIAIATGVASVKNDEYFKESCAKVVATRERTLKTLREMGFEGADSKTNFVFMKHKTVSGNKIFTELKKRNIFVRHWDKPLISEYLRISIGTDAEMDKLFIALKEIINE